eukprot:scaffold889_cov268-Pinguiococcus_pyrenoidosus.AAC.14
MAPGVQDVAWPLLRSYLTVEGAPRSSEGLDEDSKASIGKVAEATCLERPKELLIHGANTRTLKPTLARRSVGA